MKKLMLSAALCSLFFACGNKDNAQQQTTSNVPAHQPAANNTPTEQPAPQPAAKVETPAPAPDITTQLVGSWTATNSAMMESYEFKADGTYTGVSGRDELKGTWSIVDGKFIWGKQKPVNFKIEGNKMTIGDRKYERDGAN